jgi:hypothetical protein
MKSMTPRIGNYAEFLVFYWLVFDATKEYVASISSEAFEDIAVPPPTDRALSSSEGCARPDTGK